MLMDRIETTEDWICKYGDRPKSSEKAEEKPKGVNANGETTVDEETEQMKQKQESKKEMILLMGSLSLNI